jgi:hypothetical protein
MKLSQFLSIAFTLAFASTAAASNFTKSLRARGEAIELHALSLDELKDFATIVAAEGPIAVRELGEVALSFTAHKKVRVHLLELLNDDKVTVLDKASRYLTSLQKTNFLLKLGQLANACEFRAQ